MAPTSYFAAPGYMFVTVFMTSFLFEAVMDSHLKFLFSVLKCLRKKKYNVFYPQSSVLACGPLHWLLIDFNNEKKFFSLFFLMWVIQKKIKLVMSCIFKCNVSIHWWSLPATSIIVVLGKESCSVSSFLLHLLGGILLKGRIFLFIQNGLLDAYFIKWVIIHYLII